jgi:hypothetical protein
VQYATINDALAILRDIVGLDNNATVVTHDFNSNGVLDLEDALLVLRGLVGSGIPQRFVVHGGENVSELKPLCVELEWQIVQDWRAYREIHNEVELSIEYYLGTYRGSVVIVIDTNPTGIMWRLEIGEKVFHVCSGAPILVWNNGSFYPISGAYSAGLITIQDVEKIFVHYRGREHSS